MKLEELNQKYKSHIAQEEEKIDEVPRKKKWLIWIVLVLILLASIYTMNRKFNTSTLPEEETIEIADGGLVKEIPDDMKKGEYGDILQKKIDDSMFTINVKTTPVFANGISKGVIDIVNNPSNKFPCKVRLKLDDTGKEVYRCDDLIYPGQYINEIKLTENLDKGAYPATLTYFVYDEDGKEAIGIINAGINIAIQN